MSNKKFSPSISLIALFLLASNLIMSGCGQGRSVSPTITPTPSSSITPTSAPQSAPTPTQTLPLLIGADTPLSQPILKTNIDQIQLIASIPQNPERSYRISSDNKLLFVADTHGIDVFNISTGALITHLPFGVIFNTSPHEFDPSGINESHFSISANGNLLAIIDHKGLKVISLEGKVLFSSDLETPFSASLSPRAVTSSYNLALSPNGEYLAFYSSDDGLKVIQLPDGKTIDIPKLVGNYPRFSPSGKTLAIMNNNHLEFWNTADWTKIQDIYYRGYWPLFTFISDSYILLHNWSNSLELWDIIQRKRVRTINVEGDPQKYTLHAQPIISPNGELLAVLQRDIKTPCFELSPITVTVFNLSGEKLSEQDTPFQSRDCKPYFLGLAYISSPILLMDNGEVVTALPLSNDDQWRNILQEMDISFAQKILPPKAASYLQQNWKDFDYDFEPSPDGRYVAISLQKGTGHSMVIYDVLEDKSLYWGSASFTSGNFSPDSTLFLMNLWNTIKMINLSANENLRAVTVYEDQRLVPYTPMAVSADLTMLAAVIAKDAMSETVGFIDLNNGALIYQWSVGNDEIKNIKFSDDGNYIVIETHGGWIDILGIHP
jgi:hypothetical protein